MSIGELVMILSKILSIISDFSNLFKVVDSIQEGSVIVQPGQSVIEIKTRRQPTEVWISFPESDSMPVCNGDLDKVSYSITYNGFILYADAVSDTLQIDWSAIFDVKE